MKIFITRTALAVTTLLALPAVSQASLLIGTLGFGGTVAISTAKIDFVSPPSTPGAGTLANPGTGTVSINSPASAQKGDFMALAGTTATIENIENSFAPVGPSIAEMNFITFTAAPNISFELTRVVPGVDSPAPCGMPPMVPQSCTPNVPNQSPFNLDNTSFGSTASFSVSGIEIDSLTMTTTTFTGTFQATFNGQTYQSLLNTVNTGGTVTTPFSATFTTTPTSSTPEPGTIVQILSGACWVGRGGIARRTTRRTA